MRRRNVRAAKPEDKKVPSTIEATNKTKMWAIHTLAGERVS